MAEESAKNKKNPETKVSVKAEVKAETSVTGNAQKTDPGKVRVELKSAQKNKTGAQSVKKETPKAGRVKTEDKKVAVTQKETDVEREKKATVKQQKNDAEKAGAENGQKANAGKIQPKTMVQGNQVVHVTEELPVYLL